VEGLNGVRHDGPGGLRFSEEPLGADECLDRYGLLIADEKLNLLGQGACVAAIVQAPVEGYRRRLLDPYMKEIDDEVPRNGNEQSREPWPLTSKDRAVNGEHRLIPRDQRDRRRRAAREIERHINGERSARGERLIEPLRDTNEIAWRALLVRLALSERPTARAAH